MDPSATEMKAAPERRTEWTFRAGADGWAWRRTDPTGRQVVSDRSFSTLAECQDDAKNNGFKSRTGPERRKRNGDALEIEDPRK